MTDASVLDKPAAGWSDIAPDSFDKIARLAVAAGGTLEINRRGSEFIYLGQREMNGRSAPILIAVRHPRVSGHEVRKCRANVAAVDAMGA